MTPMTVRVLNVRKRETLSIPMLLMNSSVSGLYPCCSTWGQVAWVDSSNAYLVRRRYSLLSAVGSATLISRSSADTS